MSIQIRSHAIVYRSGDSAHYFSPSRFVEGASILLPRSFFKEAFGAGYADFEKAVHQSHGSYNEVRVSGFLGESSNTKTIKSRHRGSRQVIYPNMPTMNGGISKFSDPSCTCEDSRQTKAKYSKQHTEFDCSHAEAYKIVEFLKVVSPELRGKLLPFDYDLPPSKGPTPILPFGSLLLLENKSYFIDALETIHTEGEVAFDRKVADGAYPNFLNAKLRKALDRGHARWEVIKGKEELTDGQYQQMSRMKSKLFEFGFWPHGTVLEFAGQVPESADKNRRFLEQAVWDFKAGRVHARIVESKDGYPMYAVVRPVEPAEIEILRPANRRFLRHQDYPSKKPVLMQLAKENRLGETIANLDSMLSNYAAR